jgi:hypothetical protein
MTPTEQPKEYIITTDMLLQWRTGCLRAMRPYNGDGDICPGCEVLKDVTHGIDEVMLLHGIGHATLHKELWKVIENLRQHKGEP